MRQRGRPTNLYRDLHIAALCGAGLTMSEIARAWGTSPGAIVTKLRRLGLNSLCPTGRPRKRPRVPFVPMLPQSRRVQMIWCG